MIIITSKAKLNSYVFLIVKKQQKNDGKSIAFERLA